MPKVRAGGAKRFSDRASQAGQEYLEGARNPRRPWAASTAAAEGAWKKGVLAAAADGRFGRGVAKAGDSKYIAGVESVGQARYEQGVSLAEDSYRTGFAPFKQVIEGITLPPRGPKGDPKNLDRVKIMADALHQKKIKA